MEFSIDEHSAITYQNGIPIAMSNQKPNPIALNTIAEQKFELPLYEI